MYGWQPSTLQSKTRRLFVEARRRQSSHKSATHLFNSDLKEIDIAGPAISATHGVQKQPRLHAERLEKPQGHFNHFGIDGRMIRTESFRAYLIELPPAPFLLLFVAEHRPHVVQLGEAAAAVHGILQVGAHHRSRRFRAERHRPFAPVHERVHLLSDDVRVVADSPRKQLGRLQDRCPDFRKPILSENPPRVFFHQLPASDFLRQQISHSRKAVRYQIFHSMILIKE